MSKDRADVARRRRNNLALYRVFTGKAQPEDAAIARECLASICGVNEKVPGSGIDTIVNLAIHEGKRRVYLDITEGIRAGADQAVDVFRTVADSGSSDEN